MAQIIKPQRPEQEAPKSKNLGAIGTVLGAGIGSIVPGIGTAIGAGIGGTLGGAAEALTAKAPEPVQVSGGPVATSDSPVSRRLAAMQDDRLSQLGESIKALQDAPPEVRQESGPALLQAFRMEAQKRSGGVA